MGVAGAAPAPADPLDDAVFVFAPTGPDPFPFARFPGHLPALRLPPTRPGRFVTGTTGRRALIAWSVVDLWVFVAALRLGPGALAPVALAGLVATGWHLRSAARRPRSPAPAPGFPSAPAPLGPTAGRRPLTHPRGQPHKQPYGTRRTISTFSAPRRLRRHVPMFGTRRPRVWWPSTLPLSPALGPLACSIVTGAVVHAALNGASLLP